MCLAAVGIGIFPISMGATVSVSVQPSSQIALVGSNATFTAQVNATAGEIVTAYTWLMSTNGLSPFNTVTNATTATCILTNLQLTDSGYYFVRVTYTSGTTTGLFSVSGSVTLTVHDQARILTNPTGGLIRAAGGSASFSVVAGGELPLAYQWRHSGTNLIEGGRFTGATASTLNISGLLTTDSGNYNVIVTNQWGSATSVVASLNVYVPAGISADPTNLTIIVGSNASFSVTASGSAPLTYRWLKGGTNLTDGGRISGSTNFTLNITAATTADAGNYSVIVTNIVGSVTSSVATLTVLVPPTITSAASANGRQGASFTYTITATGTLPITFGADGLPAGLSVDPISGVISGTPSVMGVFPVTLYATNAALTASASLVISLSTGAPGITSALSRGALQGQNFTYTIAASNNPTSFTCGTLPAGLSFDSSIGRISGPPVPSGIFPVTITASNQYGGDSKVLSITITSAIPVITSALTKTGAENVSGFTYTITASRTPTSFNATGLPLGLSINTANGQITGTPLYGGTFKVLLTAANAYGAGTATLVLNISYATISDLAITGVTNIFSSPYLLDFSFSLRDSQNLAASSPVVRPVTNLQVVCYEDGNPIPSETAFIVEKGNKKQLKMALVLDYTFSMFSVSGAIDAMQSSAKTLINNEPAHAQFKIYEFNADYLPPQQVTNFIGAGFNADKAALGQAIDGIQTNIVQGNYAGTRCWDAIYKAIKDFGPYTQSNRDEQRYLVAMTDGNDDSSDLNTNADPIAVMVNLAQANQVKIYCVAFGPNINVANLQTLTSGTSGQYYEAATTSDLALQFAKIARDIDGQYLLRWATLKRAPIAFQPSFTVTVDGFTAAYNTNIQTMTVTNIDNSTTPPTTNVTTSPVVTLPYNPTNYAGNVKQGALLMVADSDVGPQTIRLRASYVPRYIRAIQFFYRPNFPCTSAMSNTGTNEFLHGWTMTETNDLTGLRTLTMVSPNPTNLLTSIPYGIMGELATFRFQYPDFLTAQNAFGSFTNDNNIYTNMLPNGQSFVFQGLTNFITLYPPTPPHGTPVPWLVYYGLTNGPLDVVELGDANGNGLATWQDYLAGLNPTNTSSLFDLHINSAPPATAPQIRFSTVTGRIYRIDTATTLGVWSVLADNIAGIGGYYTFNDLRNLSGANAIYYRVSVR